MLVYFLWRGGKGVDPMEKSLEESGTVLIGIYCIKKSYFKFKKRGKRVSWGSLTSWHMPAFLVPGR